MGRYVVAVDSNSGKFAIRFKEKITVHGLELEKARELVSILNSIEDDNEVA